jgi:predicted GH43/DUF377 family glycosyl hydrolase
MNKKNMILLIAVIGFSCQSSKKQVAEVSKDSTNLMAWQLNTKDKLEEWKNYSFSKERWWGDFPKDLPASKDMMKEYPWAVGPIQKYSNNPVLSPSPERWDQGRFSGGVHNGSIIIKDGIFYYIYRGERPIDVDIKSNINYICDIGVATSTNGIDFVKDTINSPFFRKGEDKKYSYEDVNVVKSGDTYYLFCNQWYWPDTHDFTINGTFLATSKDLLHWKKRGIVFPNSNTIHRNAVILQNGNNEAVRVNGKFIMYINYNLMAYSDDMIHWKSKKVNDHFPGGECCFALADYDPEHPDNMILFTGGNHTGHFYAIGEVLFSKKDPERPLQYLPRPVLAADSTIPYEHGFSATDPNKMVSSFADCIFFNGLTLYQNKWWFYYGGSEYYTCLATSPYRR